MAQELGLGLLWYNFASVEIIDCIPGTVVLTCLTMLHKAFFAPCKLYCCI